MLGKAKSLWRAWRLSRRTQKGVEHLNGKPWWRSREIWGTAIQWASLILGALKVAEISEQESAELATKAVEIANGVEVLVSAVGAVVGKLIAVWGRRKHQEAVAAPLATRALPGRR